MRSTTRFAAVVAAALVFAGAAPAAMADDVDASSADFQLIDGQNTLVLGVGDTSSVTLTYVVTGSGPSPQDGKAGCNLAGGRGTQLLMDVVGTPDPDAGAAGVAGIPGTVTFDACEDDGAPATVTLDITGVSPGITTYRFVRNAGTVAQGAFGLDGATFVVVVLGEGRDAPAIANEWIHETATDAQLASCQEANGTNPGQTNWHGQLILQIAQFFEGQTFAPDEEQVVVDKTLELCGL